MDSFYIGNLKGVGKVYQLTAIDTATRWAIMLLVLGPVSGEHAVRFLAHVQRQLPPARAARAGRADRQRPRVRSPAGSAAASPPWASPTCGSRPGPRTTTPCANASRAPPSRSAGAPPSTAAGSPPSRQLQAEADTWLIHYHHRRRNHSDFMRGRTPAEILENTPEEPGSMTINHRAHLGPHPNPVSRRRRRR